MVQRVLPVGYCPECGSFLGHAFKMKARILTQKELYLLNLVASRNNVKEFHNLHYLLREGIRVVMAQLCVSSTKKLENLLSFSQATISQWFSDSKRGTRPTLSTLLNFCVAVNVSPADLLFNHSSIKAEANVANLDGRRTFVNADKKDWVENRFRAIVENQKEIISVNQVADELKVGDSYLRYHFPDISAMLVSKNNQLRAQKKKANIKRKTQLIENTCRTLLRNGVFPSHNYVRDVLQDELNSFGFGEFTTIWNEVIKRL